MLPADFDAVCLFGADKNLVDSFRIEQCAEKEGVRLTTELDLDGISEHLSKIGIKNSISKTPTHYLCNEAYWYLLERYRGKAVLIHIPTMKNYCNTRSVQTENGFTHKRGIEHGIRKNF